MLNLFEKNAALDQDVKRNINSLRISEDLFDDLYNGELGCESIAIAAEARIKQDIPPGIINRGFHYTTGILFPFEAENYQRTRYSDGSFGCWYGSLDLDTTIYETAFHNLKNELNIEGIRKVIERQRAVYNIRCQGILIDLRGQHFPYPELIAENYAFTQQIGRRLSKEGHPGLLAPSARKREGVNVVVFNPSILSQAKIIQYLTYFIDPMNQSVRIETEKGKVYLKLQFDIVASS